MKSQKVAVCIVTYNDAEDLPACVEAVRAQSYRPLELVVVDNASVDGSARVAREVVQSLPSWLAGRCLANDDNLGFAAGMNQAFAATDAPLLLTLNADARLAPDYVERLVETALAYSPPGATRPKLQVGAITGRLTREQTAHDEAARPTLDACGMYLQPTWRHLDRGSGEVDGGFYAHAEQVFGGTGAATLWLRSALEDVALEDVALEDVALEDVALEGVALEDVALEDVALEGVAAEDVALNGVAGGGEYFDSWFHSFREDAELCFRLAERGWAVIYEPKARAVHRRCNLPERRSEMPAYVNLHSLKNRYLLRAYHQTPRNFLRTLLPTLVRDLLALGYVLLAERASLAAYRWLWRQRQGILRRRRWLQARRTVPEVDVDRWFKYPSLPLPTGPPTSLDMTQTTTSPGAATGSPLHFALLGSRGIPNRYGGYETLMEELSTRLVRRGYRVTVYCRSHVTPPKLREFKGVRLVVLPTLRGKYFDTPVHTLLSGLHVLWHQLRTRLSRNAGSGYDAALLVNSANALFVPLLRLAGVPTALHVDGIEKRRAKWGWFGRMVYALSERLACRLPNALVTDAEVIRQHYLRRYGAESVDIAYGVDPDPPRTPDVLPRLGLEPGRYFLYVSRFEPENNPHQVAAAYRQVGGDLPLVMVGGAPYAASFNRSWSENRDPRILVPGPIYGIGYRELLSGAFAYIHATDVGGTHPALVEAMGYGCCPVVNDTPENREVAADSGLFFKASEPASLAAVLNHLRLQPEQARRHGAAAAKRAQTVYSWPRVCDQYVQLLTHLARPEC